MKPNIKNKTLSINLDFDIQVANLDKEQKFIVIDQDNMETICRVAEALYGMKVQIFYKDKRAMISIEAFDDYEAFFIKDRFVFEENEFIQLMDFLF